MLWINIGDAKYTIIGGVFSGETQFYRRRGALYLLTTSFFEIYILSVVDPGSGILCLFLTPGSGIRDW